MGNRAISPYGVALITFVCKTRLVAGKSVVCCVASLIITKVCILYARVSPMVRKRMLPRTGFISAFLPPSLIQHVLPLNSLSTSGKYRRAAAYSTGMGPVESLSYRVLALRQPLPSPAFSYQSVRICLISLISGVVSASLASTGKIFIARLPYRVAW